jgi:gluconate 2-dehydrogenase gamma chain
MSEADGPQSRDGLHRRLFLTTAGVAASFAAADMAGATPPAEAKPGVPTVPGPASPASASPDQPVPHLALTETEAAFLAAAVDTLIPADALSPSASDAGVVTFIDGQLAGAWGGGARLYRSGPFLQGTPEQGYQLPLTPRQFFQAGIAAVNAWSAKRYGHPFDQITVAQRVEALQQLEKGQAELEDFPATDFFEALLQITMEGFFADPIHGGNRAMAGWKMIGFPGLPGFYGGVVASHVGKRFEAPPKSIADFL